MDILRPNSLENNPTEKRCRRCKELKPATLEFFYKDRSRKDGLCTLCKTCDQSEHRKPEEAKVLLDLLPDQKQCAKCKNVLPATPEFFQRDNARKDGLYSYCKVCVVQRRNTSEAKEKKHAYNQIYYSDQGNRERILTQRKENYHNNPETRQQALDRNKLPEVREYNRTYLKAYNQSSIGRAKNRANKHKYRAQLKSVGGHHTDQQIQDLLKRQKCKCYYCGDKFEQVDGRYVYQVDHTFPISRVAGTNIPANDISYLVLTCRPCNRKKSNKFPWEFPEGGRLL